MRRTHFKGGVYSYRPPIKRSKFEDTISAQLRSLCHGEKYEQYEIKYTKPVTQHTYTPDFVLPNGIIIEVKGILQLEDRKKHLLIKEQYPDLDIRFVFQNAKNKITKGSKTTYADWAEKNGFQYASKMIPESWLHEPAKNTTGLIPKKKVSPKK